MGLFQVDDLVGSFFIIQGQREVITLGYTVLEGHTDGHIQIGADHKVGTDAVDQNVEGVNIAFGFKNVHAEDLNPTLLGVLHEGRVLFSEAAAGNGAGRLSFLVDPVASGLHSNGGNGELIHELVFLVHQLFDLTADADDLITGTVASAHVPVKTFFFLFRTSGLGGSGNADAGEGANVEVSIKFIVCDVGDDPCPLPDSAAADIDVQQDFLLKNCFKNNFHLVFAGADFNLEGHNQLDADTLAILEVDQITQQDFCAYILVSDLCLDSHQIHGVGIHRGAVGKGDGVRGQIHVQIVAEFPETVCLDSKSGQVLSSFLDETAADCLFDHISLNLSDLLLSQFNVFVTSAVDVHRRHHIIDVHNDIGDIVGFLASIHTFGNLGDETVTIGGRACAKVTGIEGHKVAYIHGGLGVKTHLSVDIVGELHILLIHSDVVGFSLAVERHDRRRCNLIGHRQHIGSKENLLGVCGLVGVGSAIDRGNFHIGYRFILRFRIAQVGTGTLIDSYRITNSDSIAGVCKGADILILIDAAFAGLAGDGNIIQTIQSSAFHVGHAGNGQILYIAVQSQVLHLALFGDDIQHTDRGGLLHAIHKENCSRIIDQLDAIGLALLKRSGNLRAVDNILIFFRLIAFVFGDKLGELRVLVGNMGKILHAVRGISINVKRIACNLTGRHDHSNIIGGFLLGYSGNFTHLGIQSQILGENCVIGHGIFHGSIGIPTQEQTIRLKGGGQQGNLGVLGISRFSICSGQGHTGSVLTGSQREGHFIVSGRGEAAATAGRTAGAAAAGRLAGLCGGCGSLGSCGGYSLTGSGVDLDTVGSHAGFLVPGVDRLVRTHGQGGCLRAGGVAAGIEVGAVTVQQALCPQLQHSVLGVGCHAVHICGNGGDVSTGLIVHIKCLEIAHEERGHLLAVDETVGRELTVAGTAGDAVLVCPRNIGCVIHTGRNVTERFLILIQFCIYAGHTTQDRDEHCTGHGAVGGKLGCAGAVEEAVHTCVLHGIIAPVAFLHVCEGIGGTRGLHFLLNSECRCGDKCQHHAEYQQQAD